MKIEIKTLITLLTIEAVLGGFYYTTQDQLSNLETEVKKQQNKVKRIERKNTK